ncbi:nucleic acid-binding protein, partial [Eremomyces bilateralis CBS 781.70]
RPFSTTPRASFARMMLVGRLGQAPELVETATGRGVIRYAVASESGTRENRKTSWFRVASFAEGGARDFRLGLKKGSLIHVEADARMSEFEDKDGNRRVQINLV